MWYDILDVLLNDTCPTDAKEWEALTTWACCHELGPLLYSYLESRHCILPPAVSTRLRYTRYAAQAVSLVREQAWGELLSALATADIPVLVLKGAALAYTVYPDPMVRPMGDIDLLLNRDDLSRASAVLRELELYPQPEPQKRINPFNKNWTGELSFCREYQGITISVDLHWELLTIEWLRHVIKVDIKAIWERAVLFHIGRVSALTFTSEDMLLHICLHTSLHGFAHLRGYLDILQLLEHGNLDWALFVRRAQASGLRIACYFPLWWLAQYRAGMVPKEVLVALRPDPLRTMLGKWMVKCGVQRKPDVAHTWNHVAQILLVDRFVDYGRLFAWLLFPGHAWLQERYQLRTSWQLWIWSLLHPFLVLWEGVRSLGTLFKQWISHLR